LILLLRRDFEAEHGDPKSQETVDRLMPRRVKRRRKALEDDEGGNDGGWEEYFDYIFPEDEIAKPNLKLLAMAKMWKKQRNEETGWSIDSYHELGFLINFYLYLVLKQIQHPRTSHQIVNLRLNNQLVTWMPMTKIFCKSIKIFQHRITF
jgi:hypothetical protein